MAALRLTHTTLGGQVTPREHTRWVRWTHVLLSMPFPVLVPSAIWNPDHSHQWVTDNETNQRWVGNHWTNSQHVCHHYNMRGTLVISEPHLLWISSSQWMALSPFICSCVSLFDVKKEKAHLTCWPSCRFPGPGMWKSPSKSDVHHTHTDHLLCHSLSSGDSAHPRDLRPDSQEVLWGRAVRTDDRKKSRGWLGLILASLHRKKPTADRVTAKVNCARIQDLFHRIVSGLQPLWQHITLAQPIPVYFWAAMPPPSSLCHTDPATEPICLLLFHSMGPSQGLITAGCCDASSELRPLTPVLNNCSFALPTEMAPLGLTQLGWNCKIGRNVQGREVSH